MCHIVEPVRHYVLISVSFFWISIHVLINIEALSKQKCSGRQLWKTSTVLCSFKESLFGTHTFIPSYKHPCFCSCGMRPVPSSHPHGFTHTPMPLQLWHVPCAPTFQVQGRHVGLTSPHWPAHCGPWPCWTTQILSCCR